jgi:hypothetical protein
MKNFFLKYKKILLIAALIVIVIFAFFYFRSCKSQKPQPAFLHRDSVTETKIDSIKKDSEIIDLKKQISSEKITVQKYERKLNQKILTKDYEIIKVSPADSAYSHVIEFLNGFNPEPEE